MSEVLEVVVLDERYIPPAPYPPCRQHVRNPREAHGP